MFGFGFAVTAAVTAAAAAAGSDAYRPPRDNLELSLICANEVIEIGRQYNSFINPDTYCANVINGKCAEAQMSLEECYAAFFAPEDSVIPPEVKESIDSKLGR